MAENRLVEAEESLQQQVESGSDTAELRMEFAELLLAKGEQSEAHRQATIALSAEPDDPAKLALVAATLAALDPEQAIAYYERAIKIAPGLSLAYRQLCPILLSRGLYVEAEPVCREGLAVEPFSAPLHQTLGEILMHQQRVAEGIFQLDIASKLLPKNPWTHMLLGAALEANRDTVNSVREYEAALRLQPDLAPALNDLAWIRATSPNEHFRNGPEAVRLAERACQITEFKEIQLVGTLAAAYAEAGRFDEAIKSATEARDSARASGQQELASKNEELLRHFAGREPYRDRHK